MEKREKIIVLISVAVAIYGALDFFVLSKKKAPGDTADAINQSEVLSSMTTQLSSQDVGSQVHDKITNIQTPWQEKIFFNLPKTALFANEANQEKLKLLLEQFNPDNFSYTGYLEMGNNKIAIINGTDYTIGDSMNGVIITDISSKKVGISMQGEHFDIEIKPLEDTQNGLN